MDHSLQKESTQFQLMTVKSTLNWEEHIDRFIVINTIKVVAGKKCGKDWKTLKRLYSAISRSEMDYGYQLYSTVILWRLKKLYSTHRECT